MGYDPNHIAGKNASPEDRTKNIALGCFLNISLAIFSLICLFPLIWMAYSSLKDKRVFNADIFGLPKSPTISNYTAILYNPDYQILRSMFNSFRVTFLSVLIIIAFGFIVGYILSRVGFRGNRAIYLIFLMGILIPIHSLMVPIYMVFSNTGMNNKWFSLVIPYVAFGLPVGIFLVEGFVKTIPTALEEAAAIDGSSFSRTMFTIMLPICRPILVTIAIIQTFSCWNEFAFALILTGDSRLMTVPLALKQFTGQFTSDYPKIMAAMLLTMSPILVLYFIYSQHIIKGMVAGAIKG
jgi:raffinose/stachyose/melibiose transport system permease protein